jgi:hypothetical protein
LIKPPEDFLASQPSLVAIGGSMALSSVVVVADFVLDEGGGGCSAERVNTSSKTLV